MNKVILGVLLFLISTVSFAGDADIYLTFLGDASQKFHMSWSGGHPSGDIVDGRTFSPGRYFIEGSDGYYMYFETMPDKKESFSIEVHSNSVRFYDRQGNFCGAREGNDLPLKLRIWHRGPSRVVK